MICPKCKSTFITFYLSSTIVLDNYNSKGITGKAVNKTFNPIDQRPYKIICSCCKTILKEVEK